MRSDLVDALKEVLRGGRESGQPVVDEFHFSTSGMVRVTVIWDRWETVADEDRSEVIREAYAGAEDEALQDRIALAIGLTYPEADEQGLVPFEVVPILRPGDPVTLNECRVAMVAEGASTLMKPDRPVLRLLSKGEAERCIGRLAQRLPKSRDVWTILEQVRNDLVLGWNVG